MDNSERETLITFAVSKLTLLTHCYEGTKFIHAVLVNSKGKVVAQGWAQREEGEFIYEVAQSYARQNAEHAARVTFDSMSNEEILSLVN